MIRPKNETEDLLLSITKNCEMLNEQTHRKPEEIVDVKITKPRETFHFNPPIHVKGDWMLGLIYLEVYNSIFNITEENTKFEIYRDTSKKFGFLEIKDELEEILNIPHISQELLQDEVLGPHIIGDYYKLSNEKKKTDGFMIILLGYARSPFRDFESYLRIVVGLDEEDIQLILKQFNSHFITYEIPPEIYTIQDFSDTIHTFSGHSEIIQIEYDDFTGKTKIILKYIGGENKFTLGTLRFDERPFFHTLLDFEPYWDCKPTNSNLVAIPSVYASDNILNLNTVVKIHLKCNVFDGSIQNGLRQPIL